MKKLFLLLVLLFVVTTAFAQTDVQVPELEVSFSAMSTFFLKAILGQVIILVAEARKWIGSGQWDWGSFFGKNIGPFLWSLGGAVALYLILAYMPWMKDILEAFAGQEITAYTAGAFMGFATIFLKGIIQPTKDAAS